MIMKQNRKVASLTMGCIASVTLAGSVSGQDLTSGSSTLETKKEPADYGVFTLTPGFTELFDADFDHGNLGKISVSRADLRAGYARKLGEGELGFGGLYEYSSYDLSEGGSEVFNRLAFNGYYKGMVNDNWGYFGYASGEMAASTEANLGDGLMGTFAGGARYVWSDKLSLGLGVALSTSLEDDNRILPVILLQWQINDRWALRTLNGVTVTYDVTGDKKMILDAGVKYQLREYRLPAASSFGVRSSQASLIETMVTGEIGLTYRFTKNIAMRGFVGVVGGREYDLYVNDHKVGDEKVDTGAMAGVKAVFSF